jgi:hypothetical protein
MKRVIVAPSSELVKLNELLTSKLRTEDTFCSSMSKVSSISQADQVYFVISSNATLSTQYQELVIESLRLAEQAKAKCFLFRLDQTKIPQGFDLLKQFPEGTF